MNVRAVIFDVYGTLLEQKLLDDFEAAQGGWEVLCRKFLGAPPPSSHRSFVRACDRLVRREHARARAFGIRHPEVVWPEIVFRLVPAARRIPLRRQEAFLASVAGLGHTVRLAEGAGSTLRALRELGLSLGIASNAQGYTVRELTAALRGEGLSLAWFDPRLCFWSFENGFSKPDPHAFQMISTRLRALGIPAAQTLMVGDRYDNDIRPPRAMGWKTWHWQPVPGRDWKAFLKKFAGRDASEVRSRP